MTISAHHFRLAFLSAHPEDEPVQSLSSVAEGRGHS